MRKWHGILAGGRKKDWSAGDEQNGMPECGIRLFLYPRHTAEPHMPVYWKLNGGISGPSGNVAGPVVKSMTKFFYEDDNALPAEERRTRFPPGGSWTNGSFRYGCNHMMLARKFRRLCVKSSVDTPLSLRSSAANGPTEMLAITAATCWKKSKSYFGSTLLQLFAIFHRDGSSKKKIPAAIWLSGEFLVTSIY